MSNNLLDNNIFSKPSMEDVDIAGIYLGKDGLAIGKTGIKIFTNSYIKLNDWEYFDNKFKFDETANNYQYSILISPKSINITENIVDTQANCTKNIQQISSESIASTKPQKLVCCSSAKDIQFLLPLELISDSTNLNTSTPQNTILHYDFTCKAWAPNAIKLFTIEELVGFKVANTADVKIYGGIFVPINSKDAVGIVGTLDADYLKFKNTTNNTITAGHVFAFGNINHKNGDNE